MLTKILDNLFPDSKAAKFWHNNRKRALFLLPFWIIFIVLLFTIFVIPYEKEVKETKENEFSSLPQEENINEMWQNLLNFEYDFTYKILREEPITYTGTINKGIITGTKNDGVNETNFMIDENSNIYTLNGEEQILYGKLEDNQAYYYLNVTNLYNKLKDTAYTKENNQYFYEKDNLYVIIDTDKEIINSISVEYNGEKAILNFYNFR